jgi:hypothetical protein
LWSWSYGGWIYNCLCNQCPSPLTLWVRILLRQGVLDTTLCDKVCQWLAVGQWFSLGTPVSSPNKTDCHDITEIFLGVALNKTNDDILKFISHHLNKHDTQSTLARYITYCHHVKTIITLIAMIICNIQNA